jgi:hypothetical protein
VSIAMIVSGTARDTNMSHWDLKVGEGTAPATWQELSFGFSSVDGGALGQWSPPLDSDASYTLLLTATDRVGHRSEARATVRVLTKPPSMPRDLVATVGGDGSVTLDWSAPDSGQVVGYNVYRNGEKLNRTNLAPLGTVEASTVLNSDSHYWPDGATDGLEDTIWAPEPFLKPSWLSVRSNQDFRVQGVSLSWYESVLGDMYQAADYQIQAWVNNGWETIVYVENNDRARRSDYVPEPVTTSGIRILLTRGNDEDIVGIVRELEILSAEGTDLLTDSIFVDDGLSLVEGVYTVTAVDAYGHESPTATVVVDEVAPRISLVYPMDDDRVPRSFQVLGTLQEQTLSEVEVSWSRGGGAWETLSWATKLFSKDAIANITIPWEINFEGPGTLRVRAVDQAGNVTDQLVPVAFDTIGPVPPATVSAVASGNAGAYVTWSQVSAPDLLGYLVKRNGTTLNPGNLVEAAVVSAPDVYLDSDHHQPWAAADTLFNTSWWSGLHDGEKYLELAFPTLTTVNRLDYWFDHSPFLPCMVPRDFHVEAMVDGAWRLLDSRVNWQPWALVYSLWISPAVSTDRIRFTATRGQGEPPYMIGVIEVIVKGTGLVGTTSFTDTSLAAGECSYTIVSQDQVGNQGQASPAAYVDTLPPRLSITSPAAGSLQGLSTRVAGSIVDPNHKTWELSWGLGPAPADWTTVIQGSQNSMSFDQIWTTAGIEGEVTLKLTAEDLAGNTSETRVLLNVDGNPPSAPAGLAADPGEEGVLLSWIANPEADIQGYLVFRDGKPLTAGDISSQGTPWATTEYVFRFLYQEIVYPASNATDDNPGTCWRNDALAPGAVAWGIDFGEPFITQGVVLDFGGTPPRSVFVEGLINGGWLVLAAVSDNVSTPRMIPFSPVAVTSLRLRFPALDGFAPNVSLAEVAIAPFGAQGPVADLSFLDRHIADVAAIEHAWQLRAVDLAGNVGPLSDSARLDTLDPRLEIATPAEDALVGARIEVRGSVTDTLLSSWELTAATGTVPETQVASGTGTVAGGLLGDWEPVSGFDGEGRLVLSATDSGGRTRSLTRTVHVDTVAPAAPGDPVVDQGPEALNVCWNPPADADVAGYLVYRNGEPLQAEDLSGFGVVTTSPGMHSPEGPRDGNTLGSPAYSYVEGPTWWGLEFATPHSFAAVRCTWRGGSGWVEDFSPASFYIQVRRNGQWIPVLKVDNEANDVAEYRFASPVVGDGIRILVEAKTWWGLQELDVIPAETSPVAASCYRDLAMEGWEPREAFYQVASVDLAGNVGTRTGGTLLDATPPRIAILAPAAGSLQPASFPVTGTVADALLQDWTLEGSLAGGPWQAVASGSVSAESALLGTWNPTPGFKGEAVLRLSAGDTAGNQDFRELSLVVDADVPAAPTGLQAEVSGPDTVLTWNPSPEDDLAGYRVFKNGVPLTGDITRMGTYATITGTPLPIDAGGAVSGTIFGSPWGVESQFEYRPAVSRVVMNFSGLVPANATLETWNGEWWITAASVTDNTSARLVFSFSTPLESNRFRVQFRGDYSSNAYFALTSMTISAPGQSLLGATTLGVKGVGVHQDAYTVTACDVAGNESAPSSPVAVDQVPPVI